MRSLMTEAEFAELLAPGYERRGIDFKGPGPRTDKHLFAKIARSAIGMANHRDGGLVVIGVHDDRSRDDWIGLTSTELASWPYDDTSSLLAEYATPMATFDLELV